jgi:hypothetical protein
MTDPNFADRMFLAGEATYQAIERGEYTNPSQVEAALLQAQADTSTDDQQ